MNYLVMCLLICIVACDIGTDILDETVDLRKEIKIKHDGKYIDQLALKVGEEARLVATYFEMEMPISQVHFTWKSSDSTQVSVSENGVVKGVLRSQGVQVTAHMGTYNKTILVNVVETDTSVAMVAVKTSGPTQVNVGESSQLSIEVTNVKGEELPEKNVVWSSSNTEIATVSSSGYVSFLAEGTVNIYATVDQIKSNDVMFQVMSTSGVQTGTFVGKTGHSVSGTVELKRSGTTYILTFNDDFSTQNGPELYVTLASRESVYTSSDYTVAAIAGNTTGKRSYTISGVDISNYSYVHIWCKPFNVVFGSAKLK